MTASTVELHTSAPLMKNKTATTDSRIPERITAAWFQQTSNYFLGQDQTALFKTWMSIKTIAACGMLVSLILPKYITAVITVVLLGYPLLRDTAYKNKWLSRPGDVRHPIQTGKLAGKIEGDFCVLLIGARYNGSVTEKGFKTFKWLGEAFNSLVGELERDCEQWGYMGGETFTSSNSEVDHTVMIQYWRSQDQLNKYATSKDGGHLDVIRKFNEIKNSADGHLLGIWHESFPVAAGSADSVYFNMPARGIGKIGELIAARGRHATARGRTNKSDGTDLNHLSL